MKIQDVFGILMIISTLSAVLYSQDSDAGICVIGSHSPEIKGEKSHNRLSANYNLGFSGNTGGDNFVINTLSFETDLHIFKNSRFDVIIPVTMVSGPLATVTGFGDMIITYTTY